MHTGLLETCASLSSSNVLSVERETRASIGLEVWYGVYLGHWEVPGPMQLYLNGKGGLLSHVGDCCRQRNHTLSSAEVQSQGRG